MTYTVIATNHFERAARRLRRHSPHLRNRIDRTLRDLATDPHQPHLNLHRLHGPLEGFHAVRVDHDNRIVLTIQVREREITLHDIGTHDEVYRRPN